LSKIGVGTHLDLRPPSILVSLTVGARTTVAVEAAGIFAISLLSSRQEAIARRFAAAGGDHFAGLTAVFGDHSVPIVPDALAHVECRLAEQLPFGEYVIVIGQVTKTCQRDGEPLPFGEAASGTSSTVGTPLCPGPSEPPRTHQLANHRVLPRYTGYTVTERSSHATSVWRDTVSPIARVQCSGTE